MKITKTQIPENSLLKNHKSTFDYVDSFQGRFNDRFQDIGITQIGKSFFTSGPKWVDQLFELRNKFVRIFGLKTSGKMTDRQKMLNYFKAEKGEQLGLFKVFDKTENEIILGEDDKHLNFRVSLLIDQRNDNSSDKALIISTAVKFNN